MSLEIPMQNETCTQESASAYKSRVTPAPHVIPSKAQVTNSVQDRASGEKETYIQGSTSASKSGVSPASCVLPSKAQVTNSWQDGVSREDAQGATMEPHSMSPESEDSTSAARCCV